jgi:hypothetical protein
MAPFVKTDPYRSKNTEVPSLEKPPRYAYFGELHVHTGLSPDAFVFNVRATPDDAYRYAKGEAIEHVSGAMIQASKPLDFMAVTDHAEYMGVLPAMATPGHPLSKLELAKQLISNKKSEVNKAFQKLVDSTANNQPIADLVEDSVLRSVWRQVVDAAERHYRPGEFTTFIAYEWSSMPESANLHRNVIFRGNADQVPDKPFSAYDSNRPEDLWDFLDESRSKGFEAMAIPHNSNVSDGRMFPLVDSLGEPIDAAYARQRSSNEPIVEMTQIKGTSDTHPLLSPNDEWSNFEILEDLLGGEGRKGKISGSYVREALLNGLKFREQLGVNPYVFGLIGASDSHNASVPVEEDNYTGKMGIVDGTPEARRGGSSISPHNYKYSASGLAGVWAEENTREAIYDALKRRETFATSGPRISLQFYGGWEYDSSLAQTTNRIEVAESQGVPMGRELTARPESGVPNFLVVAMQDPDSAALQRLQIVKGWLQDGIGHEQVFDIACADGRQVDPQTHRCPSNDAGVNLADCSITGNSGSAQLAQVWRDPSFDPDVSAMYYVRVLENPTCRWTTWDALYQGRELLTDVPPTIQERAWSSPIWYHPASD